MWTFVLIFSGLLEHTFMYYDFTQLAFTLILVFISAAEKKQTDGAETHAKIMT